MQEVSPDGQREITVFLLHEDGDKEAVRVPVRSEYANSFFVGFISQLKKDGHASLPSNVEDQKYGWTRYAEVVAEELFGERWKSEHKAEFAQALRDAKNVFAQVADVAGWAERQHREESTKSFPRLWDLFRFLLGRKNRERLFIPAYNDLLADHLESRLPKYQTPLARRWIQCCFAIRTAWLVAQCMGVGLRGAIGAVVVPVALREWVVRWWYGG